MKKLMIAAAIVCAAAMSYGAAAEWTWATTGKDSKNVILDATGANLYTSAGAVTFYLFDAAVATQDNVLKGLRDNGSITDFTAAKTTTLTSNSRILEPASGFFEYGEGGKDYTFWMAAVVGDKVLLSNNLDPLAGNPTSPNQAAFSKPIEWTGVDKGTADWTAGGQGWYSVAAVPEPTSGLLLLLGVAGLALRRRRA